jgi:hypothetical protein
MEDVGIFYGHLVCLLSFAIHCGYSVYFMVILCIFPVLVICTMKNLATVNQRPFLKEIKNTLLSQVSCRKYVLIYSRLTST